ncbi:hypothetical protein Salat_1558600 [Sesamum alatum]|uniref:Uncharacterized protein n=1 Tax=Sesamum alatum TaxID=300844 RepID=A0AAE2CMQ9_9LAMI|nr:hypothetical protein Salat_1558600 [Sesamum alatum]
MTLRLLRLPSCRHESTHHLGFLLLISYRRCRLVMFLHRHLWYPHHLLPFASIHRHQLLCAAVDFRFATATCRRAVAVNGAGGCPCRCTADVVLGSSYWVSSFHGPSFFDASWDRHQHPRFSHLLVGPP